MRINVNIGGSSANFWECRWIDSGLCIGGYAGATATGGSEIILEGEAVDEKVAEEEGDKWECDGLI